MVNSKIIPVVFMCEFCFWINSHATDYSFAPVFFFFMLRDTMGLVVWDGKWVSCNKAWYINVHTWCTLVSEEFLNG